MTEESAKKSKLSWSKSLVRKWFNIRPKARTSMLILTPAREGVEVLDHGGPAAPRAKRVQAWPRKAWPRKAELVWPTSARPPGRKAKAGGRRRSSLLLRTTPTATKPRSAVQVKDKAGKASGRWTKGAESNSHGHGHISSKLQVLLQAKHLYSLTVSWHLAFVSSQALFSL